MSTILDENEYFERFTRLSEALDSVEMDREMQDYKVPVETNESEPKDKESEKKDSEAKKSQEKAKLAPTSNLPPNIKKIIETSPSEFQEFERLAIALQYAFHNKDNLKALQTAITMIFKQPEAEKALESIKGLTNLKELEDFIVKLVQLKYKTRTEEPAPDAGETDSKENEELDEVQKNIELYGKKDEELDKLKPEELEKSKKRKNGPIHHFVHRFIKKPRTKSWGKHFKSTWENLKIYFKEEYENLKETFFIMNDDGYDRYWEYNRRLWSYEPNGSYLFDDHPIFRFAHCEHWTKVQEWFERSGVAKPINYKNSWGVSLLHFALVNDFRGWRDEKLNNKLELAWYLLDLGVSRHATCPKSYFPKKGWIVYKSLEEQWRGPDLDVETVFQMAIRLGEIETVLTLYQRMIDKASKTIIYKEERISELELLKKEVDELVEYYIELQKKAYRNVDYEMFAIKYDKKYWCQVALELSRTCHGRGYWRSEVSEEAEKLSHMIYTGLVICKEKSVTNPYDSLTITFETPKNHIDSESDAERFNRLSYALKFALIANDFSNAMRIASEMTTLELTLPQVIEASTKADKCRDKEDFMLQFAISKYELRGESAAAVQAAYNAAALAMPPAPGQTPAVISAQESASTSASAPIPTILFSSPSASVSSSGGSLDEDEEQASFKFIPATRDKIKPGEDLGYGLGLG